jgi:hypothetical protein
MGLSHEARRERREHVLAALKAGRDIASVSSEHELCVGYVANLARRHGIETRRPRSIATRTIAILAELIRGERQVDIARRHGVTRQRVHELAKKCRSAGIGVRTDCESLALQQ